jgi:hypothetical protein
MGLVEQGSLLAGLATELVSAHQAASDGHGRVICRSHRSSWPCHAWRVAQDVCREAGIPVITTMPSPSTVDEPAYSPMALGNGIYARSRRAPASAFGAQLARASTTQMGSATMSQPSSSGHRLANRGIGDAPWS